MTAEPLERARGARPRAARPALLRAGVRRPGAGLRRLAREPLVHFFAAGLVLFALAEHHRAQSDVYRIVVTPQQARQLAEGYRAEFGEAPSQRMLSQLVDKWVDEEVLYREGVARKLGEDDEIVRRRIVQKMQFLQQDLAAPAAPSEAELQAWYAAHRADYVEPASVSFTHVFFADDRGGADAARGRAQAALSALSDRVTRAPERGDPFPDLYDYTGFGPEQARRLFGETEMSRALLAAPVGRWAGPLRSGYGWHLVRVQARAPARPLTFAEARDQVRADVIAARQDSGNRQAFARLKARYHVVRQDAGGQDAGGQDAEPRR